MPQILSFQIAGTTGRMMAANLHLPDNKPAPLIIFIHGYKGFKDWGHFPLIAQWLCENGIAVLRYNCSHNGTTPESPSEFTDLEAFAQNNYSAEVNDLKLVIDAVFSHPEIPRTPIITDRIFLLGHSRGGGVAILQAARDERVSKLVTWAAISDIESRINPRDLDDWKKSGVRYELNTRTGQNMPVYYQIREDFYRNREMLDIIKATQSLHIPFQIIHGSADTSVPVEEARQLFDAAPEANLLIIQNAQHTFGGAHPFSAEELPADTITALKTTLNFCLDHH